MECRYCNTVFTKKSNLKRHMLRKHDNKSIHHHGLQYVDKKFVLEETFCSLHEGVIKAEKCFTALHVIFLFASVLYGSRIVDSCKSKYL